jgi:ketosteroid isomerase-like protein
MNSEEFQTTYHPPPSFCKQGNYQAVKTAAAILAACVGLISCAGNPNSTMESKMNNRNVVENFFIALETQHFELLKEVFAENGRQLNPYVPEGFPKSFDGREAIYKQYSSLPQNFGQMKFPREIYATDDPNFFVVKFKGDIEIKAGGKYENDYIATFKLENGKVTEYTEYFNPIVMAKAFGIALK